MNKVDYSEAIIAAIKPISGLDDEPIQNWLDAFAIVIAARIAVDSLPNDDTRIIEKFAADLMRMTKILRS